MKKFENKLLCSDIDGTLIDDNHNISEKNLKAIEYFRENGGIFTLASGRCIEAIEPVYEKVGADLPVVCLNGCGIYDAKTKQFEKLDIVDGPVCDIVFNILEHFPNSGLEVYLKDSICVLKNSKAVEHHFKVENIQRKHYISNILDVPKPWVKFLFAQEPIKTAEMDEFLKNSTYKSEYRMLKTHQFYYEIYNKHSNKGNALKNICNMYNINEKDVFSIGDNDNDIEMIKYSKIGVAVENSSENLKEVADLIVANNNDSAIYDFVEKLDKML